MDQVFLINMAVALGIGAAVVVLFYFIVKLLNSLRGKNPATDAVIAAFMPYVKDAITAGERAAVWAFDSAEAYLDGADKAAVANAVYDLLPDTLYIGVIPIPIYLAKRIVTRDDFAALVKDAYDQLNAFLYRNEDYLRSQVDILIGETLPEPQL